MKAQPRKIFPLQALASLALAPILMANEPLNDAEVVAQGTEQAYNWPEFQLEAQQDEKPEPVLYNWPEFQLEAKTDVQYAPVLVITDWPEFRLEPQQDAPALQLARIE